MLCVVCKAALKTGLLFFFPLVSEELYRELLQTFVSLIREHTQHNNGGKGITGSICQGFVRFVLKVFQHAIS